MGWQIVYNEADPLGLGKVNVGEFAHEGGEVYDGAAATLTLRQKQRAGLIARQPGVPGSIEMLVDPQYLPDLR